MKWKTFEQGFEWGNGVINIPMIHVYEDGTIEKIVPELKSK